VRFRTHSVNIVNMPENGNNTDGGSILIPRINLSEKHPGKEEGTHTEARSKSVATKKQKKVWLYVGGIALFLLTAFAVVGFLSFDVYNKALLVKTSALRVQDAVQQEDISKMKSELENTKSSLALLGKSYKRVAFFRFIPFLGTYYSDGVHVINSAGYGIEAGNILIDAVEPYADIIGFNNGAPSQSGEQTAQERLDFIVKTLPELVPKADNLTKQVGLIKQEVDQINPDKYPEKFRGTEVRSKVKQAIDVVDQASSLLESGKPLLSEAPYLLGADKERKYLILFQNDKELRPTGGFMTAYSIGKVRNGRFDPVLSSDIYNLDGSYTPRVKAPDPIVKYLKGPYTLSPYLRLRDMNWSPSFADSMELFTQEIKKAGIDNIDGVISVDTQVLVNLLDVTGPIGVSGFGNFSTNNVPECNCPQVIYELENFADIEGPVVWSQDEPGKIIYAPANYDNRKKIIGPLMNSVLANVLAQPKEKFPALFNAVIKSLTEKHILFYLYDKDAQDAVTQFGVAGTLRDYEGDYLFINDANLGGRKSNLYVTQEVEQNVEIAKDGKVTKTLTITYRNPEKYDGWLNSVLPNWVRVYVPQGSELVSFEGLEDKVAPYDDLGRTVFAGYFQLRPQGAAKLTLKYNLPQKFSGNYNILIQKQPGKDAPLYSIQIGKKTEEFNLNTDKELKYKI
jgi:hypothetical protein